MRGLLPSVLFALWVFSIPPGAPAAELEGFLPLAAAPSGEAPGEVRLRGSHTLLLYAPKEGAELRLHVRAVQIGRYETEILAHGPAPDGPKLVVRPPRVGGPTEGVLALQAAERGVVPVAVNTAANAAVVTARPPHAWLMVEASPRSPVHVIGRCERLHFTVPRGTRHFTAFGRGGGGRENCRLTVFAPDGSQAGQAAGQGSRVVRVRVAVPEAHRGAVWALKADRPPDLDGVFEDGYLWLSDEVPAYVSPAPDGLLVPFVHGLVQPPLWREAGEPTAIELSLSVEPPAAARLHASLGTGERSVVEKAADARGVVRLPVPADLAGGEYDLRAWLAGADGAVVLERRSTVTVTPRLLFVGQRQPLVRAELVEREGALPLLVVERNVPGERLPLRGAVRLVRTEPWETPGRLGAQVVLRKQLGELADAPVEIAPPAELADGHYQWQALALSPDDELVDAQHAHFLLKGGQLFAEVPPPPSGPLPAPPGRGEPFPGYFLFVPDAADAIPYNYRPSPADLARPLRLALARGEAEPATVGLLSLLPFPEVSVTASPLRHEETGATLPVDVRLARHWPQRTSWRTTSYRIVPEMLEPNAPFSLAAGQVKQVWLTVHAPADAAPGRYRAEVKVGLGELASRIPLEVTVRPFLLQRPPHVHWGLYSDSSRWRRYPEAQVRAELADIRAHGLTTLMCYPPYHSTITYEGGTLAVDSAEFARFMRMAEEAGLGPPWVMSMQGLRSRVKHLTKKPITDPEYKQVYQGITRHFVELAERLELGECVWHAIDEPWSEEKQAEAVALLGYLDELGLPTFTTAGPVPPPIDAVLDVRCYSIGHLLGSEGLLRQQQAITRKAGDRLWYYGSGCYTGQEGNVRENRFVTGVLFWRSGAEGEWSWTFLRPKGNAHDDFDGDRHREHKDACTVYPSPDEGAPMPTLQWEGIREGIDDYAYAWTLKQAAKRAGGERGRAALARLEELMATVPVRRRAGDFTAAAMQRLREQLAAEIERLVAARTR